MSTSINFNKRLGFSGNGTYEGIVLPNNGFVDSTSWAFDGQDDHLKNNNTFDTIAADDSSGSPSGAKWSVVFWAKVDNLTGTQILYQIRNGTTLIQTLYVSSNGKLNAFMTGANSNWSKTDAGVITAGNWHLMSMVYDSTLGRYDRQKVYVDADRTDETSNFFKANHLQSDTIFFAANTSVNGELAGNLNEIAIWYGTALSQGDLATIYNTGAPAIDLKNIDGIPAPTNWFRSENAVWDPSPSNPSDAHYLMTDEMGTGKTIRTMNMSQSTRDSDVPTP